MRWVFFRCLLALQYASVCAQRDDDDTACADNDVGLAALGLPFTCADMARLSQGLAVANHIEGMCANLAQYELLEMCCAACTAIDECESSPCTNGATCVDAVAAYTCECAEGWTGTICDEVWVVPDECLEGTYIVSAANATSGCEAPRCRAINDNEAYCYQCSVCEEGFTHVADCVPERNNSRDGSDTVCAPTMCDPFPDISSLPHAATSCVTDTIYPFPASCTVMCDTGWTASSGVSETSYVCQPDGSWVNTRAVVCNDRCEDIPGWTDKDGYSCSTYAALQWCCAPNSPHCNAAYANELGQDSDDACCATCSAPCVDDDELMVQSYGYDCAWVLANDECGTLREAGLERSCGCTCRLSDENLHAPTFPLMQGTCTTNNGSFSMRDSAPVPFAAVQQSAHVFCADTTQRRWATAGVCETLGIGFVFCDGSCAARHTCSSCFSASLLDVTDEATCLRDSTEHTWAPAGVCEALGIGFVFCDGSCAARHTCSSCFSASLLDVTDEATCLRDSEHARAYRFRDVAGSADMLEFTAEQMGLPQRCSQRWDGRTECIWGFGTSDFTITAWFRATEWFGAGVENPAVTWSNLFAKAQLGMTQPGIIASIYKNDRIVFRLQELPEYSLNVSCHGCASSREWVFLSFVRYAGSLKVLQNGVLLGSKLVPPFDTDNLGTFRLGANHVFSTGLNMDAWIDDFRIYDFALSDSGVRHLYGKTLSLDCFDNYPPLHALNGTCNSTGYLQNGQSCVFDCAPGFAPYGTQPRCALGHTLTNVTCEPTTSEACMDTRATNYDAAAHRDDGSCTYNCEDLAGQLGLNATASRCDLIQTLDPSEWSSALYSVGTGDSVILQGLSSRSQRNGRVEVVDGELVIRHVSVSNMANSFGGAVESRGASVAVEHCSFIDNRADVNVQADFAGSGGAIYAHAGGELTVHASEFTSNVAEVQGGAIMLDSSVQCILTQAVFKRNIAFQGGGAIWTVQGNMYIEGCAFEGNMAQESRRRALQDVPLSQMQVSIGKGGAIFAVETPLLISSTTFTLNHATDSGGALWASSTSCTLTDSELDQNTAVQMGGAVYATDTLLTVTRVGLAYNDAAHGHALYLHTLTPGWEVFNTTIHPFSQERSVSTTLTPLSGCAENPCDAGHSCVFENFSLFCVPCAPTFMSYTGISCDLCAPGKTATADRTDCETCPSLTFSRYGVCESCPRGKQLEVDGTGCRPCEYGSYSDDGLSCKRCLPGWRPNDDVSATECIRCPPGTFSVEGISCEFCGFGFSPLINQTACERLPNCLLPENGGAGSYSLDGGVTCLTCPPGSGPDTNQTGCESCADGLVYDRSGFFREGGPCTSCPPGTRPVGTPLTACSSCSLEGKASFSAAGLTCTDCPIGSEPSELRNACIACTTSDLWFLGECQQCPSGKEPNSDHTECLSCLPGFAGVSGQCSRCENGTEPNAINSTCMPCRAGYAGVLGACDRCLPAFQPNDARTVCDRCHPDEGYSPSGLSCLRCAAGYFVNSTQTGCDPCPYGQYGTNGINCTTCAAGEQVASPIASTGCTACILLGLGYYSSDGVQCELCEDGKQPDESRATCQLCPVQMAGQQGTCSVCQIGQPSADHSSCVDCVASDISIDGECTSCSDGKQPGHNGEPACWPCDAGSAGKGGLCPKCQEAKEPNLDSFCTNPAVDTPPGCSISGVCYDYENISTSLGHTVQACTELGACCLRGHAGRGCISYLALDECRAGSTGTHQFRDEITMAYDTYGWLYDSPAYPFRALRQRVHSSYDPCTCDADGIIDGLETGRPGCAVHMENVPAFCMVPLDCNEVSGVSSSFPSLGYRWCDPGDPGGDGEGATLQWTAFSWTPFNTWNESVTVVNASMLSDDREPNRDLETFGDAMAAMNGGDSLIRYRTKISPGYTLDVDLLTPSVVEGVSVLVHADQGHIATGHSGISISVSNDSGTTYWPAYTSEAMYGSFERSATYMNLAVDFAFDRWSSHPFEDGPKESVTNVSIHFSRADQNGDSAFSLHSLRIDGPGSPEDVRCSNPIYYTYEECRAASGACSHGTLLSMNDCESHGTCCVEKGCLTKTEQSIETDTPVQLVQAYLPGGEHVFTEIPQTLGVDIVPMLESECLSDSWDWTPFVWKPDVWNEERSACKPCTPDKYSTDGVHCGRCDAGYQVNDDRTLCVACPSGWYSSASNDAWQLNLQKRVSTNVFRREALNTESDTFDFVFHQPFDMSEDLTIRMTASSLPEVAIAVDVVDFVGRQTTLQVTRDFSATFTTSDFAFVGVGACTDTVGRFVNASDKTACEIAPTGNSWHPFIPARCSTPLGATAHWNPTDKDSCEIMSTGFTWQPLIPQSCRDRRGVVVQARAHQSRAGCETAEHATGYVWSEAVPERCTDADGRTVPNITIITHDVAGEKQSVTFDTVNQEACDNAVRLFFGNDTNSTGPSVLNPFTRYNFELNCETICEVSRSATIWDYGEGFCTTPALTSTEDLSQLACEGSQENPTGNTWNTIAEAGCKVEVGRYPPLDGYEDVWACEMFYTGNTWRNYEPEFCADAELVHLEPVPQDEETCEVGTHLTGYTWADQVDQGCRDSTGAYTGSGNTQFTCENFYTGYGWHDSVAAFCGDPAGNSVNFLVDGLGRFVSTSSEDCEIAITGNTWNLDTAKIQKLVFTASPSTYEWEGHMTVLAMSQRNTGIDLLPLGTWLPDDKVGLSPADELSGVVCERCLPGLEPNALTEATGCQRCKTRGEGFYSPDGVACVECPSGRRPASVTSGFIDGHSQVFDNAQCEPCPPRFAGQLGLCRQCPGGKEPNSDHTECLSCLPGFAGVSGQCSRCENGTEPNAINSTCMPCRAGYAGVLGVCDRCLPAFQPNDARTVCDRCKAQTDPGTPNCVDDDSFVNQYGNGCESYRRGVITAGEENHARCYEDGADVSCQVSCETCPSEQYSSDGVACFKCDPGYAVNANQTGCQECPYGQFGTDGATCALCDDGSEVASFRAATRCKSCKLRDVGYYSSGGAFCAVCPEGKQPDKERTRCEPCPVGSLRLGALQEIASQVCEYCADGQTTTPQSNTACMYCLSGMAGLNGQCEACPAGKEPNGGRTACIRCPAGTYGRDGRECVFCPDGLHPNVAQTRCEECPAGFVEMSNECERCDASKEPAPDRISCQQCDLDGIGVDGQCFACDKEGRSLLTGELLRQIPNINSTHLWETASAYGRASDVGGSCISAAGAPLWQFTGQQACEIARVPSNYEWVDQVEGFCSTSAGEALPEFSDQTSCISTSNIWTSPVIGYCRDQNDDRVAHPRETCETSTIVANNDWQPAANTACEDRVPVYCRQHSLDLAAAETGELEQELDENSVANQLWREVPGFVLIAVAIVAAYALCRCAEAEAKYRSRKSNADLRSNVKDSPPVTPPKSGMLSSRRLKSNGGAGQKYLVDDKPDNKAKRAAERTAEKVRKAEEKKRAKEEARRNKAREKLEKEEAKAAKAKAKAENQAAAKAKKEQEALALHDKSDRATATDESDAERDSDEDSDDVQGSEDNASDEATEEDDADGSGTESSQNDSGAEDGASSDSDSGSYSDSDAAPEPEPEPEPEPVHFSWEEGFQERTEPDIADVVASLNRPMLFR